MKRFAVFTVAALAGLPALPARTQDKQGRRNEGARGVAVEDEKRSEVVQALSVSIAPAKPARNIDHFLRRSINDPLERSSALSTILTGPVAGLSLAGR